MAPTLRYRVRRDEQLDRHAWAGVFTFALHGAVIGVRASDGSALVALRRAIPAPSRPSHAANVDAMYSLVVENNGDRRSARRVCVLYEDARAVARSDDIGAIASAFESAVEFKIATAARTRLYVHAGVVGWRGAALVFPGRTHTGKSALVAALVRAGATYYSDEFAVLDDAGFVHPFPRALGVRDENGRTERVSPSTLGAVGDRPIPVKLVAVTQHILRARWNPTLMSPGETVLALMDNTVAARKRPADALRILGAVATGARGIRSARGEASRIAERLLADC